MKPLLTYLATLVLVLLVASMCVADASDPSEQVYDAINSKVYALALRADQLYGLPRERLPNIRVDLLKKFDAKVTCSSWTIWLDVRVLNRDPDFAIETLLPHEYAHLVQCWQGGGRIYGEAHGTKWSRISVSLGGPAYDYDNGRG